MCVVYVRVFGNTYLTCSIRSPFSDQFLCVDACKAKGMNENSKGRYTLMNSEREEERNEKQKYCRKREEKRGRRR